MKKILLIFLTILLSINSSFAIEEVVLDTTETKSEFDYLADLYYGKIENVENVSPLLRIFTQKGLEFKNSPINSVKLTFLYGNELSFIHNERESNSLIHDFAVIEPMIKIKFNENRSEAMFDINLTRDIEGHSNSFTEKINKFYIGHQINQNQKLYFGQTDRVPNSYNGALSTMDQEFVLKSQIGRIFSNVRSVGIRNTGKYKFVDYDAGIYDSTRFMKHFGEGLDFSGSITLKPFANFENAASNLKIGSAYGLGEYYVSYNTYAFFLVYDYNRFHFRSEYAKADGYNGLEYSNDKADGFYTTIAYDITPKVSLIGRYDYFNQNKNLHDADIQEFTAGITYNPLKNLKFMLNFVRRNFSYKDDSNMILFATRFII